MAHQDDAAGRRRVLVADDNLALQESLGYILESAGCEIRGAPDGAAALEMAGGWKPHVVFIDIHMPRLNGFELAKRLRAQFQPAEMKLILMSGVSIDVPLRRQAEQAGFDACIDKMADPDQWLRQLQP